MVIDEKDNVAVALKDADGGSCALGLSVKGRIPAGHKMALADIEKGGMVIKYGHPIGHASSGICAGEHVHSHNMETNLSDIISYEYSPQPPSATAKKSAEFSGYTREDGSVGIRNEIWILPTVGCVNKTAEKIARKASEAFSGRVDGIYSFSHPYGCSQLGDDLQNTRKALAGLARHPNAAGVLVLGLGCENNTIPSFKEVLGSCGEKRIKFLLAQDCEDEEEEALQAIESLVEYAELFKREPVNASKLIVGLKCGGSDGFSGITANPLVGRISNKLAECGATAILTEVPEMFGAETLLMNRCQTKELFSRTVELINNFKRHFTSHGQPVYENPSPGNKDGGITTLEEKSLGCVQKGGSTPVSEVLDYCEKSETHGLSLLNGPGNDLVSSTNLTSSGAQLILFTTGRGTPFGAPAPTLKIATNSALAEKKSRWIDFNAGAILEGKSIDEAAEELWQLLLDCASGITPAKNEVNGFRDIAIFKDGITE
ncbi:MAG: altronate dehydratase family protein [Clostridiales bacterium]|nr:altronate dehydratase family protein [Clostridiales bacterium]